MKVGENIVILFYPRCLKIKKDKKCALRKSSDSLIFLSVQRKKSVKKIMENPGLGKNPGLGTNHRSENLSVEKKVKILECPSNNFKSTNRLVQTPLVIFHEKNF
jgi:hypothetical protein